MAVLHRCWTLDVAAAREALSGLASLEDVLSSEVTERVRRIAADPRRSELLIMARLDPSDHITWEADMDPVPDDHGFERAATTRLSVLLAGACADAGGIGTPPSFVDAYLVASGWSTVEREVGLRGRWMPSLLEMLAPPLADVGETCSSWLAGGWLDHGEARATLERLAGSTSADAGVLDEVAGGLAVMTGLSVEALKVSIQTGLADLRLMLARADESNVLWIIED